MDIEQKTEDLIYCINNPILVLDETVSQMRWGIYDNWVRGVDEWIDYIIHDDTGWESICDELGLFIEDESFYHYKDYHDLTREEWDRVYEMFLEHMVYYFSVWYDQNDVHMRDLNKFFEDNQDFYLPIALGGGYLCQR